MFTILFKVLNFTKGQVTVEQIPFKMCMHVYI